MKVLGMDTSGAVASVAVIDEKVLLGEFSINHKKTHSQKLMPMLEQMLQNLELEPAGIDLYAVSIGPGSFTGLRIGIATIKGIAQALDKPVIGIPTLEGLAYNMYGYNGLICPMIDARNDTVYTALYSYNMDNGSLVTHIDSTALNIHEFLSQLPTDKQIVFIGDGVYKYKDQIVDIHGNNAKFAGNHLILQNASSIAFAGYIRYLSGLSDNCFNLHPLYVRPSQAERTCR